MAKTFLITVLPRSACGVLRAIVQNAFHMSNGEEVSRGSHSHYRRRWLCPHATPRLIPIQPRNTIYRHKHHVMRRIRLHRKESSNVNLRIQVSWSGMRTTESTLGISRRCTNAGSCSNWECSPSRPSVGSSITYPAETAIATYEGVSREVAVLSISV